MRTLPEVRAARVITGRRLVAASLPIAVPVAMTGVFALGRDRLGKDAG